MRIRDRILILLHSIASAIDGLADTRHLTTDPACVEYRPTNAGTRLDRACRGVSCTPCMVGRAFGRLPELEG